MVASLLRLPLKERCTFALQCHPRGIETGLWSIFTTLLEHLYYTPRPGATNTWIVVGINAALTGKTDLAHGALLAALDRSRNRATTVRVLRGLAARSEDDAVVAAVNAALAAANEVPSEASAAPLKQ